MISKINSSDKVVYLTFDDGPEPGITEFVLDELNKYGYKATFFCRGDNAQAYPELLQRIKEEGHCLANHTYSHMHSYHISSSSYVRDVHKCDSILNTRLFRPPHGSLTLCSWLRLRNKYDIYFWSLNSGDSNMSLFDFQKNIDRLKKNTSSGDIVLFHFCIKHENETKKILPEYFLWLSENGYKSDKL